MTAEERIAELEKQVAELKKQSVDGKRQQIAAHLIQSFGVEDDDDVLVKHVVIDLGITEATDVDSIIPKAEEAYKSMCKEVGRELPMSAAEWCEQYQKQKKEEEEAAEEMKKSLM